MDSTTEKKVLNYYNKEEYIEDAAKCAGNKHFNTVKDINKYIRFIPTWKTLEVGCGKGVLRESFPNWTGTDISKKALDLIPDKFPKILAPADKIPLPDSSFDLVVMFDFIEHVSNPKEVIDECWRLIKKDGYLIVRSPQLILDKKRVFSLLGPFRIFKELTLRFIDEVKKRFSGHVNFRLKTQVPDYSKIGGDADAIYLYNPHNLSIFLESNYRARIINQLAFPSRLGLQFAKDKVLIIKKLG